MNKQSLNNIAGAIWIFVGTFLIYRGTVLYGLAASEQQATQNAIIISVFAGLIIGGLKGKFVLTKTAKKNKNRIGQLEPPVQIHQIFAKPFYFFILGMMLLGFLLRSMNEFLGGYIVVGAIYCGIGAALIVSSIVYWKSDDPAIEKAP